MQADAADQLARRLAAMLPAAGLSARAVTAEATPRRLVVLAEGIPAESAPTCEERRGPRAGAPEAAIAGFLKATGVDRDALIERETDRGRFVFATIAQPGLPAAEALAQRLPAVIEGLAWPRAMRWGAASVSPASPRWVRPLRRIVALLGDEVVAFSALGLAAGRESEGHRFLAPGPVRVQSASSHARQLAEAHVILSAAERETRIRSGASAAAAAAGLTLVADEALVAENAGLTEWPVPLLGRFDPAFLEVPPEIVARTLKANQRAFTCRTADGRLAPAFVCVANISAPDGGRTIIAGNERVIAARLADARFFWEQDRKVPLEAQAARLSGILFHEKLGTYAEKTERVMALARGLVERFPDQFPGAAPDLVARAARLARADLVSLTVGEFPELQGVIGARVAEVQGEPPEVVEAIRQFHAAEPRGAVAVAVALADRIDTLAGFFAAGLAPTGSRDPFALRRTALSVIGMIVQGRLRLPLGALVEDRELRAFLLDRLRIRLREAGLAHDAIEAVFAGGEVEDLVRVVARVEALCAMLETEAGQALLSGLRRATGILRVEEARDGTTYPPEPDPARLAEPAERALDTALAGAEAAVARALAAEDDAAAMRTLAALRPMVDRFFDEVTVNAANPEVRANRLKLLARLRAAARLLADFSRIEGRP